MKKTLHRIYRQFLFTFRIGWKMKRRRKNMNNMVKGRVRVTKSRLEKHPTDYEWSNNYDVRFGVIPKIRFKYEYGREDVYGNKYYHPALFIYFIFNKRAKTLWIFKTFPSGCNIIPYNI